MGIIRRGVTDHGALDGLGDADHAAYIAAALLAARGDLIRRGAAAPERVALGAQGTVLASDGADATWQGIQGPLGLLLNVRGDIARRGALGVNALSLGASGTILRSDGTDIAWATLATALASLLTTRGDIIRGGAAAPERLAVGGAGRLLASDGTDVKWSRLVNSARVATGSIASGAGVDLTVTWDNAFASSAYTCTGVYVEDAGLTKSVSVTVRTQSATQATFRIANDTAAARSGTLHVLAIGDL